MEKNKFDAIDRNFRSNMAKFVENPNIWDGIDSEKIKSEFIKSNIKLDEI